MKPPSGGPSTGANRAGQTSIDRAAISWLLSALRSTTSRPTGDIMAAAAPCRMRAAMKVGKVGARPHSIEAITNRPMAPMNRLRAPSRSASQALAGRQAAKART